VRTALVGLVLFGVLCGTLIYERGTLSCDRDRGTCTVAREKVYGTSISQTFDVGHLKGAELEESVGEDSSSFKIVVLTSESPIPLMGYGTGLFVGSMREKVAAITSFATQPSGRQLDIRHENRVIALIVGAFAFVFAGAIALATSQTLLKKRN
jgi:hypothetical protein